MADAYVHGYDEAARIRLQDQARGRMSTRNVSDRMLVHSQAMKDVLDLLRTIAPHKVSVLLQGETGTGKEVLAHTLHDLSTRANNAYVVQDCGVLTETLLNAMAAPAIIGFRYPAAASGSAATL